MKKKLLIAALTFTLIAGWTAAAGDTTSTELFEHRGEPDVRGNHQSGYLGVEILTQDVDGRQSVHVRAVSPGTAAAAAGIRAEDQLLVVNGAPIDVYDDLVAALAGTHPGQTIGVRVARDGIEQSLDVVLGSRPQAERFVLRETLEPVSGGKWVVLTSTGVDLGIETQNLGTQLSQYFGVDGGVLVTAVTPDGPAERAGLGAGDIIVGWEGETIGGADDLSRHTREAEADVEVGLTVQRRGKTTRIFIEPTGAQNSNIKLTAAKIEFIGRLKQFRASGNVALTTEVEVGETGSQTFDIRFDADPNALREEIADLEERLRFLRSRLEAAGR